MLAGANSKHARRKPNGIVAVAIARELAGFCWEIATWHAAHPDRIPPASVPAGDSLTQRTPIPPKQTNNKKAPAIV